MDNLSLVFGGEEPQRGNRRLFLRQCKGHLREEEEAETSCEAFRPKKKLPWELFYFLTLSQLNGSLAREQRLCWEGAFSPTDWKPSQFPGPKHVLSCAAWRSHGETWGLKHVNQVVCFIRAFICSFCVHLSHGSERLLCFSHYAIL